MGGPLSRLVDGRRGDGPALLPGQVGLNGARVSM